MWGEGGSRAFIDSGAVQPAFAPELAMEEGMRHASGAEAVLLNVPYTRDFPYAWDVLAENLLDPSHVNFSHHGVIGDRWVTCMEHLHTCVTSTCVMSQGHNCGNR